MTDIETIQKILKVDASEAQILLEKGINVDFLKNGFMNEINEELTDIVEKFSTATQDILNENSDK